MDAVDDGGDHIAQHKSRNRVLHTDPVLQDVHDELQDSQDNISSPTSSSGDTLNNSDIFVSVPAPVPSEHPTQTCLKDRVQQPKVFKDDTIRYDMTRRCHVNLITMEL